MQTCHTSSAQLTFLLRDVVSNDVLRACIHVGLAAILGQIGAVFAPVTVPVLCSPCTFFRLGVAHIFLLGLLIDFWSQWLPTAASRKKARQQPDSAFARFVLPPAVRKHISKMASYIKLTELFKKPYQDITKYELEPRCTCMSM